MVRLDALNLPPLSIEEARSEIDATQGETYETFSSHEQLPGHD